MSNRNKSLSRNINVNEYVKKIGYIIIVSGIAFIILSIYLKLFILLVIGFSLIFWGSFIFFLKSKKYIRQEILNLSISEPIILIHKIFDELGLFGKPKYFKIQKTSNNIDDIYILIPKSNIFKIPTKEEIDKFQSLNNDCGYVFKPYGIEFVVLFEKILGINFSSVNLEYILYNLRDVFINKLEISRSFELIITSDVIYINMEGYVYSNFNILLNNTKVNMFIGDPIISALAIILVLSTNNIISIENVVYNQNNQINEVQIFFKMENY